MSYERLISEHDRIDAAVTKLLGLVQDARPQVDGVVIALSDLSCALAEHLANEDSLIYSRMLTPEPSGMSDAANEFVSEFATLRVDWAQYLSEWGGESIEADWETFRAETRSMMARLATRIGAENDLLYPAALRDGAVTLRERG